LKTFVVVVVVAICQFLAFFKYDVRIASNACYNIVTAFMNCIAQLVLFCLLVFQKEKKMKVVFGVCS